MKKQICFLIVWLLSNCVFAGFFSDDKHNIAITSNLKVIEKSLQEKNSKSHYVINIKYPQLEGEKLTAFAESFNQQINTILVNQVAAFKKQLPKDIHQSSFTVDYNIFLVQPQKESLLSVRFNKASYFDGQIHPTHKIEVFNYNLTTGKKITLADLFGTDPNYWQVLSRYCRSELYKKIGHGDMKWLAEGTAPLPENFQNWNIKSTGIIITFDEYQIATYAVGQLQVVVPYKALRQLKLPPSSPIAVCVKHPFKCRKFSLQELIH